MNSDVLFAPLDLPLLPTSLDSIKKYRHQQAGDREFGARFFRTVFLRGATDAGARSVYNIYDSSLDWQWNSKAEYFPEVIAACQALPFKSLHMVTFVGAKDNQLLPPHYDFPPHQVPQAVLDGEPYAYRVSIGDTKDAFYVSTHQGETEDELFKGRYLFGNLPPQSNHWCMTCTHAMHGTLPRDNKETLFITGILDADKHNELIARSIHRYKDYIITKDDLHTRGRPLYEIIPTPWHDLRARHPELYDVTAAS
jgi:hypothetical protein